MENNWPRFRPGAIALLLGVVGINGAFGAYLPKLGASSLRFQTPPVFVATLLLPALKMTDEVATNRLEANIVDPAASTNIVTGNASEPLGPPAPATVSAGFPATGAPPPVQLSASPVVTPQMLLQFFTPNSSGTNSAAGLIVPSPFQLPQPPASGATYNSK